MTPVMEIMPFVFAMNHTLESMADLAMGGGVMQEVAPQEELDIRSDITAVIGIHGSSPANLILGASGTTARSIASRITGREVGVDDPLLLDTFGEILNMIVGAAQRGSEAKFSFSLPIAARGEEHAIDPPRNTSVRLCRAPSPVGELFLVLVNTGSEE